MGAETALALGIATLVGGAWAGGKAISDANNKRPDVPAAPAPAAASTGDLTDAEVKKAGTSNLFRIGTFFTSPTGVLNSSTRRGSKLIGG